MLELSLVIWLVVIHAIVGKRNEYKYYILTFFPFAFLMGCRDISVGIDTYQYSLNYDYLMQMSWAEILSKKDSAWFVMEKLSSYIYADFHFWQCVYATIYFIIYSIIIKNYCNNKLLAIVIFLSAGLYIYAYNISRQMLSVAFVMLSWDLLNRNKIKQSILFYSLAILTHMSSIVSLLILFLTKIQLKGFVEKFLPIILLFALFSFNLLLQQINEYIPQYESYLDNERELHGGGLITILWAIELLFSIYVYYFSSNATKIYKIAAIGTMIYIGTTILGFSFNYAERIGYVFLPFVLLVFDYVYLDIQNQTFRKFMSFMEILCFMCFFYLAFTGLNYKFFFE